MYIRAIVISEEGSSYFLRDHGELNERDWREER